MNKADLVTGLRNLAQVLVPFTLDARLGGRVWDGTSYVQAASRPYDATARMWWSTLVAMAELIEAQDQELSKAQIGYLRKTLFGGMGSFADYFIDSSEFVTLSKQANSELAERRADLHRLLT